MPIKKKKGATNPIHPTYIISMIIAPKIMAGALKTKVLIIIKKLKDITSTLTLFIMDPASKYFLEELDNFIILS